MTGRAVIYCRVSTADQVEGTSLATQEAACRRWCEQEGLEVVQAFVDRGESAKTADRPAFLAMIDRCLHGGIDRVVFWKTDRFARSVFDYVAYSHRLKAAGTSLVSVTEPASDDPNGRLYEVILAAFAELENSTRAARAKTAMRAIKAAGGWCHRAPAGFRISRGPDGMPRLEPDPQAAGAISQAWTKILDGQPASQAYGEVAGMIGRSAFYRSTKDPLYRALDPEVHDQLQEAMRRTRQAPRTARGESFPYRGILTCSACGRRLTGSIAKGRYAYYHCRIPGHASNVSAAEAEKAVTRALWSAASDATDLLARLKTHVEREAEVATKAATEQARKAEAEVARLTARRERLVDALLAGRMQGSDYDRHIHAIDADLAAARATISAGKVAADEATAVVTDAMALMEALPATWSALDNEDKVTIAAAIFPRGLTVHSREVQTTTCVNVFREIVTARAGGSEMAPPTGWLSNLQAIVAALRRSAA